MEWTTGVERARQDQTDCSYCHIGLVAALVANCFDVSKAEFVHSCWCL